MALIKVSKLILFIAINIFCFQSKATLVFKGAGGYTSFDNSESNIAFSRMQGTFFVGAGVGRSGYVVLGPSYSLWNETHTPTSGGNAEEASMGEFGATLLIYFNKRKNWKVEITYAPNITGTRTVSGTEQEVMGSSYMADFGYHMSLTDSFVLGASVGYHSTSLIKKIVSSTETEISETYSQIIPKLEVALRF